MGLLGQVWRVIETGQNNKMDKNSNANEKIVTLRDLSRQCKCLFFIQLSILKLMIIMTFETVKYQIYLFLWSLYYNVQLKVVRLLNVLSKHRNFLIDVVFYLFCGLLLFQLYLYIEQFINSFKLHH